VHGDDEIGTLTLTMYGSDVDALVMSPTEYQLSCHMHEPAPPDFGNYVLSPMPGTLISFAVKVRITSTQCIPLYPAPVLLCSCTHLRVMILTLNTSSQEGDVVELGQELCVVEAMKMQNIIRSHKAGAKVGKLHGKVGASLRADEILVEFEKNVEP
jgi:propionyl-CoA carboxylase alpha chain